MPSTGRTRLTRDVVPWLVATASRAPSVHNTQPWQFRFVDGAVELRADPSRQLLVADGTARELVISCGAALRTLELGMRRLGLQPRTCLLPDDADPALLARVKGLPGTALGTEESQLFDAIARRRTHRGAFSAVPPTAALLGELADAARHDGAELTVVADETVTAALIALAWDADAEQRADAAWREEMQQWAPPPEVERRDGVPAEAYPATPVARTPDRLPDRDFSLERGWGTGATGRGTGVLTVLSTDADRPRDWLRAGAALQHVLLRAAADRVFARFATQPLELPERRGAVRAALGSRAFPQMVFQLGRAGRSARTPRRPVSDVLSEWNG